MINKPASELPRWRDEARSEQSSPASGIVVRGLVYALIVLCGLIPAAFALCPREGEPIALIRLTPQAVVPNAVAEADARLLWMSAQGHVIVLPAATSDLINALYRDGAFLVLAAAPLIGCAPTAVTHSITGARHP